ncbi:MAG: hypothetical protein DRG87_12600 [Deltaproteobacteria bacterium]|nr:hypothetical protein [Deltaproteobacteria bacterium]MBW2075984.1 hypothetical protein [Deltaproteobacteria bacterium]MBW2310865.1 hypothetical protein [Deltaproteobacteria bacterium]RLB26704.1 MAG: hypothetical protein DRG87_12600 [Deltaproteobacteria bacterium]
MAVPNNILIIINTGPEKQYNHQAAYTFAWVARKFYNIKKVTVMYGTYGIKMTKKGALAGIPITSEAKQVIASEFDRTVLKAEKMPDNLEQLARFEKDKMEISIVSLGTFHVLEGFAKEIRDTSNMDDFIDPITLHEACKLMLEADQIIYF